MAGKLVIKPRRDMPGRLSVHCESVTCDPPGDGAWIKFVAEAVEAPNAREVLDDPVRWLADYLESERGQAPPASLPRREGVERCVELLLETPKALAYITRERGLTEETLLRDQIGWNGRGAFTFPIYDGQRQLVNWITRPWPTGSDGRKYIVASGWNTSNGGVELYPRPLPERGWLLVEGLLDAALGRQHGLPAVTSTHGVSSFPPQCLPLVSGRKVYVMYDVGAEGVQRERVAELRAAGADARGVDLSVLGLSHGADLTDYLLCGGSADELRWFLKTGCRRAA